jgi:2-oxoglutarate dehydrogenase E2 component (dihydrolipoamide succinyltransferase)
MPTEVVMPQMGESITEGTITKWLKKPGDTVARDEPIFEITTDKVDAEIPSPAAGILSSILVEEGKTVAINTVVAIIGGEVGGVAIATPTATPTQPALVATAPGATTSSAASSHDTGNTSPLVRRLAKENNVDLSRVTGSGAGGRITREDVLDYLKNAGSWASASDATTKSTPVAAPKLPGELVPLTKMRSIIAQRMVVSKHTSAHVHTIFKVDMTNIVQLREKEKKNFEQHNGVKLTYMPFITSAAVATLRKHPIVNASLEGESIRYHENINIGIAVALEWGLIVPVIKNSETLNFVAIARVIADLAERARTKKLLPDEVTGGTFTLTNSGIFGEVVGLPIISQPQSAILGIGGLSKEPMVITAPDGSDSVAIRSVQYFALGFDHRIIDGADAGKFMADFKSALENWNAAIE